MRVRIFIDFWNFSLGASNLWGNTYRIDYPNLPQLLMDQVRQFFPQMMYEETLVYASVDPNSPGDRRLKNFLLNRMDRFPGYKVKVLDRRPRHPPSCNNCQATISVCPQCGRPLRGTVEKGVDTTIVTAMLQHAWDNTYDLGFPLSSDRDFVPAAEFLHNRGKKIVHVGYDPYGQELAAACWTHINLVPLQLRLGSHST